MVDGLMERVRSEKSRSTGCEVDCAPGKVECDGWLVMSRSRCRLRVYLVALQQSQSDG